MTPPADAATFAGGESAVITSRLPPPRHPRRRDSERRTHQPGQPPHGLGRHRLGGPPGDRRHQPPRRRVLRGQRAGTASRSARPGGGGSSRPASTGDRSTASRTSPSYGSRRCSGSNRTKGRTWLSCASADRRRRERRRPAAPADDPGRRRRQCGQLGGGDRLSGAVAVQRPRRPAAHLRRHLQRQAGRTRHGDVGVPGRRLNHDATTLGGNSGSVVMDLATGQAVGLHFGGYEGDRNMAVQAPVVADRLADTPDRTGVGMWTPSWWTATATSSTPRTFPSTDSSSGSWRSPAR